MSFSGNKQTDMEIFKYIDDKDMVSVCSVNKYTNSLLNEEKYWIQRFFYIYGKYDNMDVKKYKEGKSWKEYYIEMALQIRHPFPYYSVAMATALKRLDIRNILLKKFDIHPVKRVFTRVGKEIEYYYTRDGDPDGIKEGPYFKIYLLKKNNNGLDYQILSLFPTRLEEYYSENVLRSSTEYIDNIKTEERIYELGRLIKSTKWTKKGVKIYEEICDEYRNSIKEWFISGEQKSEGEYEYGKKDGIWYRWNKKGDKTTKYFREGKPVDYIATPEELAYEAEYLAEMKREIELLKIKNKSSL